MAFADRFIVRNSLYVTTVIAACVAVYMVVFWESMPVTQGIIGLYYILIAAHEWEELKYPGGFVELAISLTDMPMRDMRIPKFALLCITVYMLLIPFCFPQFHWLVIGALVLGIIEPLAHIVAGRANPKTRIYSPGMVTCSCSCSRSMRSPSGTSSPWSPSRGTGGSPSRPCSSYPCSARSGSSW